MDTQLNPGDGGAKRCFDGPAGGPECLRCRHVFGVEELGRIREAGQAHTYIECAWCDARNEVRSMPRAGLGVQPAAVVVRILHER